MADCKRLRVYGMLWRHYADRILEKLGIKRSAWQGKSVFIEQDAVSNRMLA